MLSSLQIPTSSNFWLYFQLKATKRELGNVLKLWLTITRSVPSNFTKLSDYKGSEQCRPPVMASLHQFVQLSKSADRFQVVGGNRLLYCSPMPTSNWLCICCHGRRPYLKGARSIGQKRWRKSTADRLCWLEATIRQLCNKASFQSPWNSSNSRFRGRKLQTWPKQLMAMACYHDVDLQWSSVAILNCTGSIGWVFLHACACNKVKSDAVTL